MTKNHSDGTNIMNTILLLLIFTISAVSEPVAKEAIRDITSIEAKQALTKDKELTILDIRTPKEFTKGHIKGAINIDFHSETFKSEIEKLDRTKSYLVHCRSGGRSSKALTLMKKLGFDSILHMKDGYLGWNKNHPIAK